MSIQITKKKENKKDYVNKSSRNFGYGMSLQALLSMVGQLHSQLKYGWLIFICKLLSTVKAGCRLLKSRALYILFREHWLHNKSAFLWKAGN